MVGSVKPMLRHPQQSTRLTSLASVKDFFLEWDGQCRQYINSEPNMYQSNLILKPTAVPTETSPETSPVNLLWLCSTVGVLKLPLVMASHFIPATFFLTVKT
jgi:hypothetical protein